MDQPSAEPPIWTERFPIRSYDVDGTRHATFPKLFSYFLEVSWRHAEALGFGFTHLRGQGKFWVLSRLRCEMQRYPKWGDELTLQTWPRGFEGAFAFRDFELLDQTGQRLCAGTSAWLILDSITKRPQRPQKIIPSSAPITNKAVLERNPEKLDDIDVFDSEIAITTLYSDIDVNQHVSASRYVTWMLDSYPIGFQAKHSLRVIDVNYLNETGEGEQVLIRTKQSKNTFAHSLIKQSGIEACRARLEWSS